MRKVLEEKIITWEIYGTTMNRRDVVGFKGRVNTPRVETCQLLPSYGKKSFGYL